MNMGVEPKIGGKTPQIIHLFIIHEINTSILGVPLFLETPIYPICMAIWDPPTARGGRVESPDFCCEGSQSADSGTDERIGKSALT